MRRRAWQRKRVGLLRAATEELRIEQSGDGREKHSGAQPRDGEARLSRWLRRKGVEGLGEGSALICSGMRRKCTAEPRSARDKRWEAKHGEGRARQCGDGRRHCSAQRRPAKEEQRNGRLREGGARHRHAMALSSSAVTSRERRRRRAAEQCYAGQRRSKAAACDGDGLIRAARALLCTAQQGEAKAGP